MSIPARPDRDSDLLISTGLRRGERLADEVERLRAGLAESERVRTKLAQTIAAIPDAHAAANLAHARIERDRLRAAAVGAFGKLHSLHRFGSSGQEFTDQIHREVLVLLSRAMDGTEIPDGRQ